MTSLQSVGLTPEKDRQADKETGKHQYRKTDRQTDRQGEQQQIQCSTNVNNKNTMIFGSFSSE